MRCRRKCVRIKKVALHINVVVQVQVIVQLIVAILAELPAMSAVAMKAVFVCVMIISAAPELGLAVLVPAYSAVAGEAVVR